MSTLKADNVTARTTDATLTLSGAGTGGVAVSSATTFAGAVDAGDNTFQQVNILHKN